MQREQLKQLPKAEQLFREYVNIQAQALIQQSQAVAKKYLNERQELTQKTRRSIQSKQKIQKSVEFLNAMLEIPEHLRQNINEMRGMTNSDLQEMREQYEQLLDNYKSDEELKDKEEEEGWEEFGEPKVLESIEGRVSEERTDNSDAAKRRRIGRWIQILEGVTYAIAILIFIYKIVN